MRSEPEGDRVALITGASGGLGPATAAALAATGMAVGLHYRTNREVVECLAERLADVPVYLVQGDLSTHDGPPAICREVEETLGPIDILVNNGGSWVEKALLDTEDEEWDDLMQADARGAFLAIRTVAPAMCGRGWGRIVNMSTVAAERVGAREGAYGVAKAAVNMITRTFAVELAAFGITVNAIAPAWTLAHDQPYPPCPSDYPECAQVPDRRPGHAREVADLVRFLTSEAAGHINGQIIGVDGGLAAVLAPARSNEAG